MVIKKNYILYAGTAGEFVRDAVALLPDEWDPVETVETESVAREQLESDTPACFICDYGLLGDASLELVETVRESHPTLPVLFITREPSTATDAVTAGATDTFVRRTDADDSKLLARRLDTVLGSRQAVSGADHGSSESTDSQSVSSADLTGEAVSTDGLKDLLLDTIEDVFYLLDTDGKLVQWNEQFEAVTGYESDELAGMHAVDFFDEQDHDRVREAIETVLETGSVKIQAPFTDKDGEQIPFDWTGALLTDAEGTASGVVGIGRDITEQRERERELQLKNRAMDEAPVGISISDPDKDDNPLIYVNDEFEALTGYESKGIQGENCRFLQGPDTDPETVATMREAIDAAEPVSVELQNYRADGTKFWNRVTVAPVTDDAGNVTHYTGFQENITTRKQQELELKLKNRAMEEAPVGITLHDATAPETPITYTNDAFEQLTGYGGSSVKGETIALLSGPNTDDSQFETLTAALEQGTHTSAVVLLYQNDSTPFWGRVTLAPVTDGDGEMTHFVGFLQDVTDQKEHEQEIQRRLNEFGELLAEDLRHPLQDARTALEAVTDSEELDSAERALGRAEKLIDDLATVHTSAVSSRDVLDTTTTTGDDNVPLS